MSDHALKQLVLDELNFEPSLDSTGIGVQAENSVITLTGHVPTYAQRVLAEQATWRVKGVRAVVQHLEVRLSGRPSGDEAIAEFAVGLLKLDTTVPSSVTVTVNKGWLTLHGEVPWHYQRINAEKCLSKLAGITGISNQIAIASPAPVHPKLVRENIENALKRSAEVEANQIRIEVSDGGAVRLEGRVDTWRERVAAERAAWATPGVRQVADQLQIR